MEERLHFEIDIIQGFAVEVLKRVGYPTTYARATANALVEADKRGIFSHGLAGGTGLEECVKMQGAVGRVNLSAKPRLHKKKYPSILVIDAKDVPGHFTSVLAVKKVKDLARKQGTAKVFVYNANHFGAAGIWSSLIAEDRDLVGCVTCTTVACVKPMGDDLECQDYTKGAGTEVRTGTNPVAISIPHANGIITLDMAMSRMAASYCVKCYKTGELMKISNYVADKDYGPTIDPKDYVERKGSIFPLGSVEAGYKGDALLKMIEIDNSLGGGPIHKVALEESGTGEGISHTFSAQVVDFLYSREDALDRVRDLMQDYQMNYFGPNSRWPGDRALRAKDYALREGIPYSDGQVENLRSISAYVGLRFEEIVKPLGRKTYPTDLFRK